MRKTLSKLTVILILLTLPLKLGSTAQFESKSIRSVGLILASSGVKFFIGNITIIFHRYAYSHFQKIHVLSATDKFDKFKDNSKSSSSYDSSSGLFRFVTYILSAS